MRRIRLAFGLATLMAPTAVWGQTGPTSLEGAWRVAEVASPGARTVTSPQPGLLLFSGRFYSYVFVTSDGPRPAPDPGLASAEALLAVWNPFTANAGTFELAGSTMTRRPMVAKNPDAMAPGVFNEYTFRLSGDTLWTTATRTEGGPVRSPSTVRYVRVR